MWLNCIALENNNKNSKPCKLHLISCSFISSVTDEYIFVEFDSIKLQPDDPYMLEFVSKINWNEDQPQVHGKVTLDEEDGKVVIKDAFIGITFTCFPVEYNPPED